MRRFAASFPEIKIVAAERKLVCMRADHPLAAKAALAASDLGSDPIVAPWEVLPRPMLDSWLAPFRPNGRQRDDPAARSHEECLGVATRGGCVYCVPASVKRFYPRADLVFRPILDVPPAEIAVAWHREAKSPAVASFIAIARTPVGAGIGEAAPIQKRSS